QASTNPHHRIFTDLHSALTLLGNRPRTLLNSENLKLFRLTLFRYPKYTILSFDNSQFSVLSLSARAGSASLCAAPRSWFQQPGLRWRRGGDEVGRRCCWR